MNRELGPESRKASPESLKAAPESRKAGSESRKAGPESRKIGSQSYKAGPESRRVASESRKVGSESRKCHPDSARRRALPVEQTRHPEGSFEACPGLPFEAASEPGAPGSGSRRCLDCPVLQPRDSVQGALRWRPRNDAFFATAGFPRVRSPLRPTTGQATPAAGPSKIPTEWGDRGPLQAAGERPAKAAFPLPGGWAAAGRRRPQHRGRWPWERTPDCDLGKGRRRASPAWRHSRDIGGPILGGLDSRLRGNDGGACDAA